LVELGRTRVFAEAYKWVRRKRKRAENDAQRKKSHFWVETNWAGPIGPAWFSGVNRSGNVPQILTYDSEMAPGKSFPKAQYSP